MLLIWEICRIECRVARFVVLSVYPRLLSQMFSPSDISVRAAAVVRLRAVRAVVILAGAAADKLYQGLQLTGAPEQS